MAHIFMQLLPRTRRQTALENFCKQAGIAPKWR